MILATIFLLLLAYLLYTFGLRRATLRAEALRFAPAFLVFGLLLFLTAVFAMEERITALKPLTLRPVMSLELLDEVATEKLASDDPEMLLVGEVSQLPAGVTIAPIPQTAFNIRLQENGMVYILLGEAMQALGWPAINGRNTLSEGQPVIVLGTLQMSVDINGLDDGRAEQYFIAEVIYAGTLAEFQRFMPRFAIIPTMTLVVSVLSAFVVIATPFLYLRTLQQRSDDVQQISEPQQSTA
jgi:hypothetical protein